MKKKYPHAYDYKEYFDGYDEKDSMPQYEEFIKHQESNKERYLKDKVDMSLKELIKEDLKNKKNRRSLSQ